MQLSICVVISLLSYGKCIENDKPKVSGYELQCSTYGGTCVMEQDCPLDRLTQTKGLCPLQQKNGVECCYNLYDSESKCRQNGGECFPKSYKCPKKLTVRRPGICSTDEICCILI